MSEWDGSQLNWRLARRGLIGPARLFGQGKIYNPILYYLLVGAVLPVITWVLARRYPKSWVRFINIPVALAGCQFIPPATGINYSSWFLFGFIFRECQYDARRKHLDPERAAFGGTCLAEYVVRRRFFGFWSKFNFVLSAGLDAGTVLSAIIIFFALLLPKNGTICGSISFSVGFRKLCADSMGCAPPICSPQLVGQQRVCQHARFPRCHVQDDSRRPGFLWTCRVVGAGLWDSGLWVVAAQRT